MSPSVQSIPLGKDFPSGQWSKVLLVGSLHCVLDEAFANCEKAKPKKKKVLDFPLPLQKVLSHQNADSTISVHSITHIASSQRTEFSHSFFWDSSLKNMSSVRASFNSVKETPVSSFLSLQPLFLGRRQRLGLLKLQKVRCYKNNPAKCLI